MKTIGAVTVARSDYGIYRPVLRAVDQHPELELQLTVSGAHLSGEFGHSIDAIESDGFTIAHRVEMLRDADTPGGITDSIARGLIGFARIFESEPPDILLLVGDRIEMHTAALAALPFKIPIAHVHGGEITEGAIDDALRHSMTKLSHLHFVAATEYARRILQLGEEEWRVIVSGAPSLDNIATTRLWGAVEVARRLGLDPTRPPLLVTYHPVTLEFEDTEAQTRELLAAIEAFDHPIVFTAPNADTAGRRVRGMIEDFVRMHPRARMCENLGTPGYFSVMAWARAMVGNSSSGIIEAPSFGLPVVNIGTRQGGRMRGKNVIDVGYGRREIQAGIARAVSAEFRRRIAGLKNPYGDGRAAARIVGALERYAPEQLIAKRFIDRGIHPAQQRGRERRVSLKAD